jgi:hypothetical protein
MEFITPEVVIEYAEQLKRSELIDLSELQLVCVGGGIGDVVFI